MTAVLSDKFHPHCLTGRATASSLVCHSRLSNTLHLLQGLAGAVVVQYRAMLFPLPQLYWVTRYPLWIIPTNSETIRRTINEPNTLL